MSLRDELALDHAEMLAPSVRARDLVALVPAVAAIAYPFTLQGFHMAVSGAGSLGPVASAWFAAVLLLAAFLSPGLGLALALRSSRLTQPSWFQLRARQLALLSVAAPPLFVFIAFLLYILHRPVPEPWAWVLLWSAAALWTWIGQVGEASAAATAPATRLRVAHGAVAAIVVTYILFHQVNHLFGLIGPDAHAAVMKLGRKIYRAPAIEPLLVGFLLFQVVSGGWLAWRWSALRIDRYRMFQVASGVYLWFFILTHMNSALVSARLIHKTDTNWSWASGAPTGLIQDAWNIRLLPHYALGVFFVLSHLASGLRSVLLAHGLNPVIANRAWWAGLAVSALVSAAIISGLCGMRIRVG
jgi:hypothetical protein